MLARKRLHLLKLCTFTALLFAAAVSQADRGHGEPEGYGHGRDHDRGHAHYRGHGDEHAYRHRHEPEHRHGDRRASKRRYRYFPAAEVYFDIDSRDYFYLRHGVWLKVPVLPPLPRLRLDDFITLELDTDRPYTRHEEHRHGHVVKTKGPPPHAPAHGYRAKQHTYHYFPGAEVYFDVDTKLYFYLREGAWVSVPKPPPLPGLNLNSFVKLEMDSDQPYSRHEEHVRRYPAKNKGGNKHAK